MNFPNQKAITASALNNAPAAPFNDWTQSGGAEHIVQFYEQDAFLVEVISEFIGAGLGAGEGAVVIATPAHRDALEERLEAQGIDLAAVQSRGQYTSLDAVQTLQTFMVNDSPDPVLFYEKVGGAVARTGSGRRRLRAFGEMVALLWTEGNHGAALKLEELWNELAKQYTFTLFCAYPINSFNGTEHAHRFTQICQNHSQVLPSEEYAVLARTADERLRSIALLQQKAHSLESEMRQRSRAEEELKELKSQLEVQIKELRRRNEQLATFVETSALGLHWVSPEGIIIWANAAELEMMGYTREEYTGRPIADFHVDQPVIQDILRRLSRNEKLHNYEARLKCKDGSIKTVLIDSSALWEDGRFVHTQCFTRDITDRKRAEETTRRLAAIVEFSDDAVISTDLDGRVASWNHGAQRLYGYTAEEMIGRPVMILLPPDRLQEEANLIQRMQVGERIDHYETIRKRKDGTLLDVSLSVSPVKNAEGQPIGASKIARDITEHKRAQRALEEARRELAQANEDLERRVQDRTASLKQAVEQMEEFSYTVSHDLRAPLRAMRIYSQALLEDFGSTMPLEANHYLKRVAENAARLDKMILDVLTLSRIARAECRLTQVCLDKLVREVVENYPGMQPPQARIQIEPLMDVLGHEPSLTQAISNLLTNAVKFVAPGCTPEARVWTERRGTEVRLWVEDKGIGIDPKYHNRLFHMFERIHPKLPYEGTGVGLAIVRKATERMGGKVGMESDGAHGSRFWIQLRAGDPT